MTRTFIPFKRYFSATQQTVDVQAQTIRQPEATTNSAPVVSPAPKACGIDIIPMNSISTEDIFNNEPKTPFRERVLSYESYLGYPLHNDSFTVCEIQKSTITSNTQLKRCWNSKSTISRYYSLKIAISNKEMLTSDADIYLRLIFRCDLESINSMLFTIK